MPNLGTLVLLLNMFCVAIALWFILPSELLTKEDFRRKLRILMLYQLWNILMVILNEILSYVFKNLPTEVQFLVAFLIAGCREFDLRVRAKIITNMMGEEDETGMAFNDIIVDVHYANFVSTRLDEAELTSILCFVAIDFGYHLITTYGIIREHRKIASDKIGNVNRKKNLLIKQLEHS